MNECMGGQTNERGDGPALGLPDPASFLGIYHAVAPQPWRGVRGFWEGTLTAGSSAHGEQAQCGEGRGQGLEAEAVGTRLCDSEPVSPSMKCLLLDSLVVTLSGAWHTFRAL